MTPAQIADNLPPPNQGAAATNEEIREHVRGYLPSIDAADLESVASAMHDRLVAESAPKPHVEVKYVCESCDGEDIQELCHAWFDANGERDMVEFVSGGHEYYCNDCGCEVAIREEPL